MQRTAGELATLLSGVIEGDPTISVNRLGKIEDAESGAITFLSNPDYEGYIYDTGASVAIVSNSFRPSQQLPTSLTLIKVDDPYAAFAQLLEYVGKSNLFPAGIHPSAWIAEGAHLGDDCYIGPFVVLEKGAKVGNGCQIHAHVTIGRDAELGENTQVFSGAKVLHDCVIGNNCSIQAGAIIGSDGFGFVPKADHGFQKVPQTGNVIVKDDCEIGAATTIDRATLGSTIIGKGVKLDNQIQVAHNVIIGDHTVIAAQTGIAGSTTLGAQCMVGGQVGFAGHIKIADGVKIAAQSGVTTSIKDANVVYQGTPACPIKDYQQQQIAIRKLTRNHLFDRVDELERSQKNSEDQP
ncbi:MAG: UDP-3-O-(3-hydroxymyristoyl)glucosamine N-acyltransferase [Flavobacteriales bacterium]|nr:UDP-3-O-(3-hydroxymyristoyl)glucosamine N-acyltransferase [Flavobacteriales bacterium]